MGRVAEEDTIEGEESEMTGGNCLFSPVCLPMTLNEWEALKGFSKHMM